MLKKNKKVNNFNNTTNPALDLCQSYIAAEKSIKRIQNKEFYKQINLIVQCVRCSE